MIVAEIRSFSDHGNNISGEKVSDYRNRDVDLAIIDCIYLVLLRPQLIANVGVASQLVERERMKDSYILPKI